MRPSDPGRPSGGRSPRAAGRLQAILLVGVAILWTPSVGDAQPADSWTVEGGAARSAEIVARYREILERRPEDGRLLDLLIRELGGSAGVEREASRYAAAADADPSNWVPAVMAGLLYKRLDQWDAALPYLEAAHSRAPGEVVAARALGEVYLRLDRRQDSERLFEAALAAAGDRDQRRDLLRALADLAFEARDYPRASAYIASIIELEPGNVYVRMELAELLVRNQQYDAAVEQYAAVRDGAGRDTRQRAVAMKDIGDIYALEGRIDDALGQYEAAMRLVEPGYWLYRELERRVVDAYRADGRLADWLDTQRDGGRATSQDQLVFLASLYEELGRDDDALALLEQAIRRDARGVDARLAQIRVLERRGNQAEIASAYAALIRVAPGEVGVRFRWADVLRRQGDQDGSRAVLAEIGRRFASDVEALVELADRYARMRATAEALEIYERIVRLDPRSPSGYVALGSHHFQEGRRSEAERIWQQIPALFSNPAEGQAALGDVLLDHTLLEEAILAYEEARRQDPTDEGYQRQLARSYQQAGRLPQSLRLWEGLRSSGQAPLRAEARTATVRIWSDQGRLVDRAPEQEALLFADPPNLEAGFLAAEAWGHVGRVVDAERVWLGVLERSAENVDALVALERLYADAGRVSEAISVLERVAAAAPNRAREAYQRLAEYSLRVHADDDAVRFARLAVELNPDDATAHARLADVLRQMHRLPDSIAAYREALSIDTRAWPVYFSLADVFLAQDRASDALELYETVAARAQDEAQVLQAGRRAIRIRQAAGTLERMIPLLEVQATQATGGEASLKLLIEVFEALVVPAERMARFGPPSRRDAALIELDDLGRRALRPSLDALAREDLALRTLALRVLSAVGNPAAAPSVVRLLDDSDATLRSAAALALARMSGARAIGGVVRGTTAQDLVVQRLSAAALTRSDADEARQWALETAGDVSAVGEMRAMAVLHLGRRQGDDAAVDSAIGQALLQDSPLVQRAAIWAVAHRGLAQHVDLLAAFVERGALAPARDAAWALAALGVPEARQALIGARLVGPTPLRQAVAALLARHPSGIDLLATQRAESTNQYLGELGVDVPLWLDLLMHADTLQSGGNWEVTASDVQPALRALWAAAPSRRAAVLAELASEDPSRDAVLAQALVLLATAPDPLLVAAGADDPGLQVAALRVLAALPTSPASRAVLLTALDSPSPRVLQASLESLARVGEPTSAMTTRVRTLLGHLAWNVRRAAVSAWPRVGGDAPAAQRLALEDAFPSVRLAAFVAWLELAPETATPQLAAWAPAQTASLRLAALAALDARDLLRPALLPALCAELDSASPAMCAGLGRPPGTGTQPAP